MHPRPSTHQRFGTRLVMLATAALPLVAGAGDLGRDGEDALRTVSQDLASTKVATVAVVDFTDLAGRPTELGRFVAEELAVALTNTKGAVQVIDRNHLGVLLKERKRIQDGLIEPAVALDAAQAAGAQALITGTLIPFGETVRVTIKALDARSARILSAATFDLARTKAIDDLLSRTVQGAAPTEAATQPPRGQSKGAARPQRAGWFLVELDSCLRQGSQVVCTGTVTNTKAESARVEFKDPYAVDPAGNQSARSALRIGVNQVWATLEPQLPVRLGMTFEGLPATATAVSIVLPVPGYVIGRGFGAAEERLTFRAVPVESE